MDLARFRAMYLPSPGLGLGLELGSALGRGGWGRGQEKGPGDENALVRIRCCIIASEPSLPHLPTLRAVGQITSSENGILRYLHQKPGFWAERRADHEPPYLSRPADTPRTIQLVSVFSGWPRIRRKWPVQKKTKWVLCCAESKEDRWSVSLLVMLFRHCVATLPRHVLRHSAHHAVVCVVWCRVIRCVMWCGVISCVEWWVVWCRVMSCVVWSDELCGIAWGDGLCGVKWWVVWCGMKWWVVWCGVMGCVVWSDELCGVLWSDELCGDEQGYYSSYRKPLFSFPMCSNYRF